MLLFAHEKGLQKHKVTLKGVILYISAHWFWTSWL